MGLIKNFLKPIVTAACFAGITLPSDAMAADHVEDMLGQLRTADEVEAKRLVREIRLEWGKSGSASADLLLKRGRDALESEDAPAAIEHLTALTDHAPDFAEGWVTRARAFHEAGMYGPALSDLEHALALNPMHFEAISGLAVILEAINRPKDAFEAYTILRSIHPHHPHVSEALDRLAPQVSGQQL